MAIGDRLRVMFVIDFLYGLDGGTENQLVKLINNLDKRVYDIHLLCLRNSRWVDEHASELKCKIKCYHIMKLKKPKNILLVWSILRYVKMVKPNVVMTYFPLSNVLGVAIARMAGVKCIVSSRRDYGLWLGKGVILLRLVNRLVKRILTNSYRVRDLTAKEEGFEKSGIDVIYNGINMIGQLPDEAEKRALKVRLGIPEGVPVVGIVAGLKPMKRHVTFIKAARIVLKTNPNVHFLIVGDGALRGSLEAFTHDFGIIGSVHFAGTQENVVPFLGILDLGINCSANEGLSNAIMEYMAYGVPCIASNAGGNTELIENDVNGNIFELDNEKELSDRINQLLFDSKKKKEFSVKSKEIIQKKFTLEKMVDEYNRYFTWISKTNRE
jgi:glycosyltransferase involved in cell wall biosynthesis